jgi:hypothetical protein
MFALEVKQDIFSLEITLPARTTTGTRKVIIYEPSKGFARETVMSKKATPGFN